MCSMMAAMSPRLFAKELLRALAGHRMGDVAAQLAFWALLALFPFCIFLLTIVGYVPLHGLDAELLVGRASNPAGFTLSPARLA